MAQLTQRGLVYKVGRTETRQFKDKTFVSRSLILEQPRFDNYTGEKLGSNYIKFEATRQETCDAMDRFPEGTKVEVEFILRGSLFQKKDGSGEDVFTHLELRSITLMGADKPQAPAGAAPIPAAPASPAPAPASSIGDYDDELGF